MHDPASILQSAKQNILRQFLLDAVLVKSLHGSCTHLFVIAVLGEPFPRLFRDIQAAKYHPYPEKEQHLFRGEYLLNAED